MIFVSRQLRVAEQMVCCGLVFREQQARGPWASVRHLKSTTDLGEMELFVGSSSLPCLALLYLRLSFITSSFITLHVIFSTLLYAICYSSLACLQSSRKPDRFYNIILGSPNTGDHITRNIRVERTKLAPVPGPIILPKV